MAIAKWMDVVIAESDDIVVVEGNQYFPISAIKNIYFIYSQHTTYCPWKGVASYYHLKISDQINENSAWYYATPQAAAMNIKNRIAFWKGVQVD